MSNKIAIITGASRGLGKNTALHLARQGVDIIGTYHSREDEAQSVVAEIEALGGKAKMLRLDVGNSGQFDVFVTQIAALLKAYFQAERIDFLVNNAGIGLYASCAETTEAQFDQLVNVHFKGPFFLTQKLLPLLADGGRIVNLSSGLARFSPVGYAAYASMKGAIEVWTRYLAKELGPRGITVNAIAPGALHNIDVERLYVISVPDVPPAVTHGHHRIHRWLNDNDFTSLPDDLLATARVNHTMYGRRIAG